RHAGRRGDGPPPRGLSAGAGPEATPEGGRPPRGVYRPYRVAATHPGRTARDRPIALRSATPRRPVRRPAFGSARRPSYPTSIPLLPTRIELARSRGPGLAPRFVHLLPDGLAGDRHRLGRRTPAPGRRVSGRLSEIPGRRSKLCGMGLRRQAGGEALGEGDGA